MAIDASGRPTTTGIMDVRPKVPQAPDLRALKPAVQQQPKQTKQTVQKNISPKDSLKQQFPEATDMELEFAERSKSLTDEDKASLQSVLSPSVRTALAKILPEFKPVMDAFGTNEPNVVIPLSVASKYAMMKYGGASIDEAIQNFTTDLLAVSETPQSMEQTTNVPPSPEPQGLIASPQTMEQV